MTNQKIQLQETAPASVFISYARGDEEGVILIEQALQERGIRVLRDKTSLSLGAHNVQGLIELINERCDAILFYITEKLLHSDFIWRYEVPTAISRWQCEPKFHIIPILQDLSYTELTAYCADRGLPSLADFNAERINASHPSPAEARRIATRTLRSALDLRLVRSSGQADQVNIALHSFPYTPPATQLHLDLNWENIFSEAGPSPQDWQDRLLPALEDVGTVLAQRLHPNLIATWLKARLPVGIAFGYAFPAKGSLKLLLHQDDITWACDGIGSDGEKLSITKTMLDREQKCAIVEVAISREISPAVTLWRKSINLQPRWRVKCTPSTGPSRDALISDAQARAWARLVGDELRKLWDVEGVEDIHLFLSSSVEFAIMLGQQLRDRRPIHVYYGDNEAGYKLAYTLGK